ncbi:hypothetical protein HYALB_00000683 [Hymenoscyphus albidus]|uniref:Chromo domain-containing protein n=1 Tax=Hymenoscyphus albidus TaxID=595503 RepID=A0A9N9PX17_9HELO|nr:hypothetical protein HYALB_00000683 [Hymenoscyphus albidus]
MPPQLSDDERSESASSASPPPSRTVPVNTATSKTTPKPRQNGKGKAASEEDEVSVVEEKEASEGEDEDDEEIGEDEYVVEKICNHTIDDETGELRFEVKWEGYSKKSDRTWEPKENLVTASAILDEYLAKFGGEEALKQIYEDQKTANADSKGAGRKRGRSSAGVSNGGPSKKGRKSHPASATPPPAIKEFKPPTGSWEEDVVGIDACEGTEGDVIVYLTWKGNHKTQHPLSQVYKRCPQRMLKFYEQHLVFKKTDVGDD